MLPVLQKMNKVGTSDRRTHGVALFYSDTGQWPYYCPASV